MIKTNKMECNKGDIWFNGKYHTCPVDYCRIGELQAYLSQRKSKDKSFFSAQNELKQLITIALQWELLK